MTRRRWIADEVSENRAALIGHHADHLVRVLRARVGQEFDIVADTTVRRGRIVRISENRVEFELGEETPAAAVADLTLLLAIFKFDRFEWAIEKCTELGVKKIIPVVARRTDAHLASASAKRVDRWRRMAVQSAEQSRRAAPPEVPDPIKLQEALRVPGQLRIVLSESELQTRLRDLFAGSEDVDVVLAIGPEGGWTEDELSLFAKDGWTSASLGATILRAETAAIAATALAISQLND
ncbi:MAG: RsmE family RNA methyltransferase [Candidatus Sulfotelmatobacter sp.]